MMNIKEILVFFIASIILVSCQTNNGNQGPTIIFADVIGSYSGQCADYDAMTSELMNREEATLSLVASTLDNAQVNVNCNRFEELIIPVRTASAAEIIFEKSESADVFIQLKYFAAADSMSLIRTDTDGTIIFTGTRI